LKLGGSKLIPNRTIEGLRYTKIWKRDYTKNKKFAGLFGIDPDNIDLVPGSNFYTGDELTKEEIIDILKTNDIVPGGIIGRIKAELIFHSKFTINYYSSYGFQKIETVGSDTVKYQMTWKEDWF